MIEKPTKAEKTKEIILQQSLVLFEKDGYESVTMRDLAKACDLGLGSFYYHFKNKEEIVLELFKASLSGHIERTHKYLNSRRHSLEEAMMWICRDRFAEFESYRAILRVLVQRLDPQDPVSPWHVSSESIRMESVALFDDVASQCLPNFDSKMKRQLARALWLQHLLILGVWSFDRSADGRETDAILKYSTRLWKQLPALVKIPGMKAFFNLLLSPLERLEREPI